MRVLVTGATGYVGGRLVPRLIEAGHAVGVLVRDAGRYRDRTGSEAVEVIEGDLLAPQTLGEKLGGFDAAFYLVHSMLHGSAFSARDKRAAENFANAVGAIGHVVYLGGILPDDATSAHLRSRAETGATLERLLPGKVTEFRAGPIIGSGSASFEMVRYLTERLPVMLTPKWVDNTVQPIAIRDVLSYLIESLKTGPCGIVSIGAEPLTFRAMMSVYAEERGLTPRRFIRTPVLAPGLAARWVGFFTPISNRLAVPLVEGMTTPLYSDTAVARERFPGIAPMPYRDAVRRTLDKVDRNLVETRWSDALGRNESFKLTDEEGLIREVRRITVQSSPEQVFAAFTGIGGEKGWLVWGRLWAARGAIDRLIGGPGLRRGRRDPKILREGETLDFWRVERVERPKLLRLRAEMKVPGRAWLQWETEPGETAGTAKLTQTALFEPKGFWGALYWYSLYPIHLFIFSDMVRAVGRDAERSTV